MATDGQMVLSSNELTPELVPRFKLEGPTDEALWWVAYLYRLAVNDPPTRAVEEALDLHRSTAGRWIADGPQAGRPRDGRRTRECGWLKISVNKRNGRWLVRWRESDGRDRSRSFNRKVDADGFDIEIHHQLNHGTYVDPSAGRTPLNDYAQLWLSCMRPTWRGATAVGVESNLRKHLLPVLSSRPLSTIRRTDMEALYASLALSASTVGTVHQHLTQVLSAAAEDGLLVRNPAKGA